MGASHYEALLSRPIVTRGLNLLAAWSLCPISPELNSPFSFHTGAGGRFVGSGRVWYHCGS